MNFVPVVPFTDIPREHLHSVQSLLRHCYRIRRCHSVRIFTADLKRIVEWFR